jgi:hypothetical protein
MPNIEPHRTTTLDNVLLNSNVPFMIDTPGLCLPSVTMIAQNLTNAARLKRENTQAIRTHPFRVIRVLQSQITNLNSTYTDNRIEENSDNITRLN